MNMEIEDSEDVVVVSQRKEPLDPLMSIYFLMLDHAVKEKICKQLEKPYEIAMGLKEPKRAHHKIILRMCENLKDLLTDNGLWNSVSVQSLIQRRRIRFTICHNLFKAVVLLHKSRVKSISRSTFTTNFFTFHYKRQDFPHLQVTVRIPSSGHPRKPANRVGQPDVEGPLPLPIVFEPPQVPTPDELQVAPLIDRVESQSQLQVIESVSSARPQIPNIERDANAILPFVDYERTRRYRSPEVLLHDVPRSQLPTKIPVHRRLDAESDDEEGGPIQITVAAQVHAPPVLIGESETTTVQRDEGQMRASTTIPVHRRWDAESSSDDEKNVPVRVTVTAEVHAPYVDTGPESVPVPESVREYSDRRVDITNSPEGKEGQIHGSADQVREQTSFLEVPQTIRGSAFSACDGNETRRSELMMDEIHLISPQFRDTELKVPSPLNERVLRASDLQIVPEIFQGIEEPPPIEIPYSDRPPVPSFDPRLDAVNQFLEVVLEEDMQERISELAVPQIPNGEIPADFTTRVQPVLEQMNEPLIENNLTQLNGSTSEMREMISRQHPEVELIEQNEEIREIPVPTFDQSVIAERPNDELQSELQAANDQVQIMPQASERRRNYTDSVPVLRDVLGSTVDERRSRVRERRIHLSATALKKKYNRTFDGTTLVGPSYVIEQLSENWLDVLDVRRVNNAAQDILWQPYDFVECQREHGFNFLHFPEEEIEFVERLCEKNLQCWSVEGYKPKDSRKSRIGDEADEYLLSDLRDYARSAGKLSLFTTTQNFLRSKRRSMILLEQKSRAMVDTVARLCDEHDVDIESFREFHVAKRQSALPLDELISQREAEFGQDEQTESPTRQKRESTTSVERFGRQSLICERQWIEEDGEKRCIEILRPVPGIRVIPADGEEHVEGRPVRTPYGFQRVPHRQRIVDIEQIVAAEIPAIVAVTSSEGGAIQSRIQQENFTVITVAGQELPTHVLGASEIQEQPPASISTLIDQTSNVPGSAVQLEPPLMMIEEQNEFLQRQQGYINSIEHGGIPQKDKDRNRTAFFDSDEEYQQRKSRTITCASVFSFVETLWETQGIVWFTDLCPLQMRRGNVAKTFGHLLHLHSQRKLYLDVDGERLGAEAVLILAPDV